MTKRAILVSLLLLVSAGAVTAAPLIDGNVDAGKKKSAVCAACHGADGNSANAQFPNLAGQNAHYIYSQLKLFKSGTRKNAIMAGQVASLSDQDMKDLAVYFSTQTTKPRVVPNVELAQRGAEIYHGGEPEHDVPACSGCHGPAGQGNPAAGYPHISGQHAGYIEAQLKAYRDGTRSGTPHAVIMHGVTRGLSNGDIKALAAYVTGLMPAKPDQENTAGALLQNPPEPETDKAAANNS